MGWLVAFSLITSKILAHPNLYLPTVREKKKVTSRTKIISKNSFCSCVMDDLNFKVFFNTDNPYVINWLTLIPLMQHIHPYMSSVMSRELLIFLLACEVPSQLGKGFPVEFLIEIIRLFNHIQVFKLFRMQLLSKPLDT